MKNDILDMNAKLKERAKTFVLNADDSWGNFDNSYRQIIKGKWHEVKFLDSSGDVLHDSMNSIPNDTGGIYVFVAKPNIIPDIHQYILYIGRAQCTKSQNLKKRCREYLNGNRPQIFEMVALWGEYLYIKYLPLSDNDIIKKLEDELIRAIDPPCNTRYPDKIRNIAKQMAFR